MKEILFEVAHEQVSIGGGHMGAHGYASDPEEMTGVEGEVIVGKDKLCELDKELSGWLGVARALYVYLGLRAHQHLRS